MRDAILLIVAALDKSDLSDLLHEARELDLDALVEVHDERELEKALEIEADVLGINNRDLSDFTVEHRAHVRAARGHPGGQDGRERVGLPRRATSSTTSSVSASTRCSIGETLMRAPDIEAAARELTGFGELL